MAPADATPPVAVADDSGHAIPGSGSTSSSSDIKANIAHALDDNDGKNTKLDVDGKAEAASEKVEDIEPVSYFKLFR